MKRRYFISAAVGAVTIAPALLAGAEPTNIHASGRYEPTWYCGSAVVWLNLDSGIYYRKGDRLFGRTKRGAYVCEKETKGESH